MGRRRAPRRRPRRRGLRRRRRSAAWPRTAAATSRSSTTPSDIPGRLRAARSRAHPTRPSCTFASERERRRPGHLGHGRRHRRRRVLRRRRPASSGPTARAPRRRRAERPELPPQRRWARRSAYLRRAARRRSCSSSASSRLSSSEDTGLGPRPAARTPTATSHEAEADDDGNTALAQTAFLKRAVEATETFAERQGFLDRVERTPREGRHAAAGRRGDVLLPGRRPASCWCSPSLLTAQPARRARRSALIAILAPAGDRELHGQPEEATVRGAAPRHPAAAVEHAAGRLLDDAGRGGGLPGGVRADGQGAAPGRHRGPPRPTARGGARRRRRAHGVRRLRLGRHGHPHPAGGRRQPGRAAHDRGRDHDPARAAPPRRRVAHGRGSHVAPTCSGGLPIGLGFMLYDDQPRVHRPAVRGHDRPDHARRGRSSR